MANASLVSPVDLARFTLAYVAIAGIPGYAAAVLARPRADWIERAALAIPCACSLVALSGLATALLGLPFGLPAYGALALPIALAVGYTAWRKPATGWESRLRGGHWTPTAVGWQQTPSAVGIPPQTKSADPAPRRWWLVAIGAAVAQVGVALVV